MEEPHKAGAERGNGKIAINLAQPDSHLFPKTPAPSTSCPQKTPTASTLQLETHRTPCCLNRHCDALYSLLSAVSHAPSCMWGPVISCASVHTLLCSCSLFKFLLHTPQEMIPTLMEFCFMKRCTVQRCYKQVNYNCCRLCSGVWERVQSCGKTLVCAPLPSLWLMPVTVKLLSSFCWWGSSEPREGGHDLPRRLMQLSLTGTEWHSSSSSFQIFLFICASSYFNTFMCSDSEAANVIARLSIRESFP